MKVDKEDRLILLTNDDGLYAGGLRRLTEIMEEYGKVVVIAATESRSGMSQALTVKMPIRVKLLEENERKRVYACSGTPADGVKIAISRLLERRPDWVVSGINHGSNASVSVIYSGTMAAAIEGCLYGINSVGFSLNDFSSNANFDTVTGSLRKIMDRLAENPLPRGVCLNVNFPSCASEEIKGIRVCRQAAGNWQEEFDKRKDPMGKTYYWLTGVFLNQEPESEDTDEWALANGYVSVVPVSVDMTAHAYIDDMRKIYEDGTAQEAE